MQKNKIITFALIIALIAIGAFFVYKTIYLPEQRLTQQKVKLSSPQPETTQNQPLSTNSELLTPSIPKELNLDVPFTSQAPTGVWDHVHEEDCEEAAMLMASRYFAGKPILGPEDADRGLAEIVDWENVNLGESDSTTADQISQTLEQFFKLKTEIVKNPTIEQIKQALAANKLVIMPAAGRQLGNPFYKAPGPLYHMLLIKGYNKDQLITNDPGTKRGANYPYDFNLIMNANHDWNEGNVDSGQKVIIIVSK